MATPTAYLAAMTRARQRGLAIDAQAARDIEKALRAWADDIQRMVVNLPDDRRLAANRSARILRDSAAQLEKRVDAAVAEGVDVSISDTLAIWEEASMKVAETEGVPDRLMGAIARAELTTTAAFRSANSSVAWRSLVRTHTHNAATDVNNIIGDALAKSVDPDTLARALEPYVLGRDKAPEPLAEVIHSQPVATRSAGYTMKYNATRIAFSESHNARRESEVAHFAADPLVEVGKWTLSPNRGTQRQPDACDALAKLDWYGLGAGVFPLSLVPLSPHPFDRCELMPIVRGIRDAARAKPGALALVLDPRYVALPGQGLMTPAAEFRIRITLARILNSTPARAAA